jgi:hypothetical protein
MINNFISENILKLHSNIINNKWSILFLIFGILIAYALGKKLGLKRENFDDNKNKLVSEKFHSPNENNQKDDMINKAIERGVKNVKSEPIITKKTEKHKFNKVDLKQYVHKTLVPDIDDYVSKDDVGRNYISKKMLDKKYMLKESCKPVDVDYTKYISRDVLKDQYVSKMNIEKKYIKKEDCDCSISHKEEDTTSNDTSSEDSDVIQKVEIRKRKKIIEVPEIVYKKVKVEVEEPEKVEEPPVEESPPVEVKKIRRRSPKSLSRKKTLILLKSSPKKKSKCNSPRLLKQQSILDKNKLEMNDAYAKVDDNYTYCNAKSCSVNGFPNGLSTLNP